MGGRAAAVSALAVIVIAALAVALVVGGGDAPSDDVPEAPPRIQVSDLPEGLTVDQSTGRVLSEVTVTWHVYDEYHAFTIDGGRSQYTGTEVTTDALILDPGSYTITVGGEEFGAVVSGDIQRTVTWMYDAGSGPVEGGSHTTSISSGSGTRQKPADSGTRSCHPTAGRSTVCRRRSSWTD